MTSLKITELVDIAIFSRASTGTYFDAAGALQTAPADVLRQSYDPLTGAFRGVLIEQPATNVMPDSEDATTFAISPAGSLTVTPNAVVAPDGALTADLLAPDTGNSFHTLAKLHSGVTSTQYTASAFLKSAGYHGAITLGDTGYPAAAFVVFDLENGTVISVGPDADDYKISPAGQGWWRVSVTATTNATSGNYRASVEVRDASGAAFPGDGVSGIYWWGMQVEQGVVATSYIPTGAAAATRAGDSLIATEPSAGGYVTGTIGLEFFSDASVAGFVVFSVSDGTWANRVALRSLATNQVRAEVAIGGTIVSNAVSAVTTGAKTRAAIAWDASGVAMSINGGAIIQGAASAAPQGLVELNIGSIVGPVSAAGMPITKFVRYPERLSNDLLKEISK